MTSRRSVLAIFGTRPEVIELAPVREVLGASRTLGPKVCVTGQHREMLAQTLALFGAGRDAIVAAHLEATLA